MKSLLIRLVVVGAVGLFTTSLIGCSEDKEDTIGKEIDTAVDKAQEGVKDAEKKAEDMVK